MRKLPMLIMGLLLSVTALFAQTKAISGKVVDESGAPIANASVLVKGTTIGTTTKSDGTYTINVPATAKDLVISSVNYSKQEIRLGSATTYNVTLKLSVDDLDEVVVTGYNRQKKSEYSGASSRVTAKEITNLPVASFDQLLQGRAPGLSVLSGSGQPGTAATIILRGPTSITGGSTPLYIVDGIPVEAAVFQGINANDIESVDVLKDASAAALYGSRGAAGVIVVTTKRGKAGKLRTTYSGQVGYTLRPQFNYPMMDTEQLLKAQEDYGRLVPSSTLPGWAWSPNNPAVQAASPAQQATFARLMDSVKGINIDWDDIFFRQGRFNRHEITLSGGTGKTLFYSNLSYYGEEGITYRTDMRRLTWRNNIDYADDKFSMQLSTNLGLTQRNFQESDVANSTRNPFFATRLTPPYQRLFRPDGSVATGVGNNFAGPNTYERTILLNRSYNDQLKIVASANFAYKITKNLTANAIIGADFRETQNTFYNDPRTFDNTVSTDIRTRSGSISEGLGRFLQYNTRASLNYNKTFASKHELDVSAVGEYLEYRVKNMNLQGFGIDPRRPNTLAGITPGSVQNQLVPIISGGRSVRALASAMGLAKYTFDKKYTVNLSYRYDGSSQLPQQNRYTTFYSAGVTWDVLKENFMRNFSKVNTLRMRASYGTSANADNFPFGDFGYLPQFSIGADGAGNQTLGVSALGNPAATWEFTKMLNVGVDFAFFNSRLNGTVEFYNKLTEQAFANQSLSLTGGFGAISANAAKVRNRGVEYSINYDLVRNKNLVLTLNANGSYNHNEVVSLGQVANFQQGTSLISVGLPLGTHWEVGWAGVDPASGRPLYYDAFGNVTNLYSAANRTQRWGTSFAPWIGGFGYTLRYRNLDMQVLMNYQDGSFRVNNLEFFMENPGFLAGGLNSAVAGRFWRGPGDTEATVQSPLYQNQFSSKYIQDASFLRLRTVTIGYNIPERSLKQMKFISSLRFYLAGQNLATWAKWKGYDPEDNNNISLSEFPNPRTITMGVDIRF